MKKRLIALAFGTLALGMSEFVMMGILSDIARSLHVTIPQAGHLISAYAPGICFGAPLTVLVACNLGNAIGAYMGGLPIEHGLGYQYTALPGAAFALLGMLMSVIYIRKFPHHATR